MKESPVSENIFTFLKRWFPLHSNNPKNQAKLDQTRVVSTEVNTDPQAVEDLLAMIKKEARPEISNLPLEREVDVEEDLEEEVMGAKVEVTEVRVEVTEAKEAVIVAGTEVKGADTAVVKEVKEEEGVTVVKEVTAVVVVVKAEVAGGIVKEEAGTEVLAKAVVAKAVVAEVIVKEEATEVVVKAVKVEVIVAGKEVVGVAVVAKAALIVIADRVAAEVAGGGLSTEAEVFRLGVAFCLATVEKFGWQKLKNEICSPFSVTHTS